MESIEDYTLLKQLGRGTFATVSLATSKATGEEVAIKTIVFRDSTSKDKESALNEARILASLKHPNIIGFRSAFFNYETQVLYIVMEYAAKGDVFSKIQSLKSTGRRLPEKEIWKFLLDMVEALKYLHENKIVHRDLKPANIFQSSDGTNKLADFNVSKITKNCCGLADTVAGSPLYASPEIWGFDKYDDSVDVWSLGVTAYQLTTLNVPFPASDMVELRKKIKAGKISRIHPCYTESLNKFILSMLTKDASKRPSPQQLLTYILFDSVKVSSGIAEKQKCQLMDTITNPDELYKLKPFDLEMSRDEEGKQPAVQIPIIKRLISSESKQNMDVLQIIRRDKVHSLFQKAVSKSNKDTFPKNPAYIKRQSLLTRGSKEIPTSSRNPLETNGQLQNALEVRTKILHPPTERKSKK